MAIHNEILVGRFNRHLQKFLSMKGPPPTPQLAGEVMPTLQLDRTEAAEQRYLSGWDMYGITSVVPAQGAGNRGAMRFRNPSGSGAIAVVSRIFANNNGGLSDVPLLNIDSGVADLGTPVTNTSLARYDARSKQNSAMSVSLGTIVITAREAMQLQFPVNQGIDFILNPNQEIPVLPGDALSLSSGTLNQVIIVSWVWRERALEDSEKF